MNLLLKISLFVGSITLVTSTVVSDCENGIPMPTLVEINNCKEQPCKLVQGSNVVMNMTFQANDYLEIISPEVIATVLGISINYPLPQKDGCQSLINTHCPIAEDEIVTYNFVMPILASYPTINMGLQFNLNNGYYDDKSKTPMFCFKVNCQVVKA